MSPASTASLNPKLKDFIGGPNQLWTVNQEESLSSLQPQAILALEKQHQQHSFCLLCSQRFGVIAGVAHSGYVLHA